MGNAGVSGKLWAYVRRHHVGLIAIFLILGGGTAYAVDGPNPGQNTIGSEDIIGNEIKSDDLGNGRIFNLDIADEIITGAKLKDGTVTGADIDESSFNNTLRAPAFIRSGNESGTGNAPDIGGGSYQGLVVRKINSTTSAAGSVVARTDTLRLVRDGSPGGLRIEWDANPGKTLIDCIGIRNNVDSGEHEMQLHLPINNPATAGSLPAIHDGNLPTMLTCQFGNAYNNRHFTIVQLFRHVDVDNDVDDNYWVGTVTSTFNQ